MDKYLVTYRLSEDYDPGEGKEVVHQDSHSLAVAFIQKRYHGCVVLSTEELNNE